MEPHFDYYPSVDLPAWDTGSLQIKVVAGNAFEKSSPLQGYSPLFMVDVYAKNETTLDLRDQLKGEVAFVIVKGSINDGDERLEAGQMLISKTNEQCEICLEERT